MTCNLSILIYSLAGGGAERVVSILLNELKEKYNITLVLMNNTIVYDIPKNTTIVYLENSIPHEHGIKKILKLPFLGWKYKKICQSHNIDISLAFMNRPSYISIFAKLFGNNVKTIISERSTPSHLYKSNSIQSKISKLLIRYLYPEADFIIANSAGNREDLIHHFSINPTKLITIHNPFDIEKIQILSCEEVNDFTFDKFTFISVGRVDHGKNHKLIIEAFKELNLINTQLLILGDGPLLKDLQNLIQSYGLQTKIFLPGFTTNPYKYLSKSDCFVFSSIYEGFPNVLVEAMSCELPVISTDCPSGPREILAPNTDISKHLTSEIEIAEYGILCPINNLNLLKEAMKIFFLDRNLHQNYAVKALQGANLFHKKNIVSKYLSVLEAPRL